MWAAPVAFHSLGPFSALGRGRGASNRKRPEPNSRRIPLSPAGGLQTRSVRCARPGLMAAARAADVPPRFVENGFCACATAAVETPNRRLGVGSLEGWGRAPAPRFPDPPARTPRTHDAAARVAAGGQRHAAGLRGRARRRGRGPEVTCAAAARPPPAPQALLLNLNLAAYSQVGDPRTAASPRWHLGCRKEQGSAM
jgi:hypothetical protein